MSDSQAPKRASSPWAPSPLIAIVGPTATGKSALAIALAQRFRGEVVNADSRQVYRRMDIGTAKSPAQEREQVPHHLFDLVDPDGPFSLALYLNLAQQTIADIHRGMRLPLLVGGTGQYVWALLEGWRSPQVPPDPAVREHLLARAQREGGQALYEELQQVDPVTAKRIDPRNLRRVIRALEVFRSLGAPASSVRAKLPPPYRPLILGLTTTTRQELYQRIDARVDSMLGAGWLEEVRKLLALGYPLDLPAMSSVGYRELGLHLQGHLSLSEAVQRVKTASHRVARHQYAWFRLQDPRIHWLTVGEGCQDQSRAIVERFLAAPAPCHTGEAPLH
ncbi:MAG: tRNA (adenosine(37)-N6)-dimethylallyltransferase MiaA [Chloroflexi bacterium]|nr:tRNA (adenosine(37)-N6)-dimethylallyltransferase MiaA [Chloroflexota bacterium]